MMRPGRRFWHIVSFEGLDPYVVGPLIVVTFKQFLPRGAYEKDGYLLDRKKSLIQVYTDPGGWRTLAAADVRLEDPRRTGR
jgi:hypothetical protein